MESKAIQEWNDLKGNGWTFWHYKLGSSFVPIDNLRQKFLVNKGYL